MSNKDMLEMRRWFLDAAVTTSIPLFFLFDKTGLYDDSQLQNMPYHELSEAEVIPVLTGLFEEDLIEIVDHVWSEELDDYLSTRRPSQPTTPTELEVLLHIEANEDENIWEKGSYYTLTAKGGAYWESLAKPNWDDFIVSSTMGPVFSLGGDLEEVDWAEKIDWSNGWQRSIAGLTPAVIREAMQIHDTTPMEGSEQWSVLKPWKATYWKTFPLGHQVLYPCSSPMPFGLVGEPCNSEHVVASLAELDDLMKNQRYKVLYGRRWYQSPWHDED